MGEDYGQDMLHVQIGGRDGKSLATSLRVDMKTLGCGLMQWEEIG